NTTFGIRDASDLSAKPTIESGVNIGAGAVIVGDIVIGHHSKIAPNTVVIESVPPFSTVFVKPTVITKDA
ncbi:MAG: serine O-acetyltransferase, partial [Candidatus Endobugula sp.]